MGFEPTTPALRTRCSPAELHPHRRNITSFMRHCQGPDSLKKPRPANTQLTELKPTSLLQCLATNLFGGFSGQTDLKGYGQFVGIDTRPRTPGLVKELVSSTHCSIYVSFLLFILVLSNLACSVSLVQDLLGGLGTPVPNRVSGNSG